MKADINSRTRPKAVTQPLENLRIILSIATEADREVIYRLRHEVYSRELGQHAASPAGRLRDAIDDWNIYLVARIGGQIAGFISLTPAPSVQEGSAELRLGALAAGVRDRNAPNRSSALRYS